MWGSGRKLICQNSIASNATPLLTRHCPLWSMTYKLSEQHFTLYWFVESFKTWNVHPAWYPYVAREIGKSSDYRWTIFRIKHKAPFFYNKYSNYDKKRRRHMIKKYNMTSRSYKLCILSLATTFTWYKFAWYLPSFRISTYTVKLLAVKYMHTYIYLITL